MNTCKSLAIRISELVCERPVTRGGDLQLRSRESLHCTAFQDRGVVDSFSLLKSLVRSTYAQIRSCALAMLCDFHNFGFDEAALQIPCEQRYNNLHTLIIWYNAFVAVGAFCIALC